ncbi:Bifunctional protein PyrR [bioreactor metagenome]|uniref:Bifunctional protein PyrR n=1 Tax=bioreactor metagenome TaxID=1076179 RepID=A0A645FDI7_9ZZZZ|nr:MULTISPECIES: bifunctional pyr operon transcriptional regulator/uracil phosphoribosyltransferase PyrR [unclassified Clostridium]KGK86157.1 bifunctional pyrimidine regulatory protein PyrR uracil phosphoribosyltransferase [Clostridium sp. HMP27]MBE6067879.1 bifunctional pyr operon transcriptional regulator/uracil phosphoribosyltransferase PyrR [Clostridium lundense]
MELKAVILDDKAMKRALARVAHEIIEKNKGVEDIVLIGVKRRGVPLAQRIAKNIEEFEGVKVPVGSVDITLYRDDLTTLNEDPNINNDKIEVEIKGKKVIIVDDVVYTGRTVRASIDAIFHNGRPNMIQLAVMVDRGHRELPIRPDYVGKNIPTSHEEIVSVAVSEIDGEDSVKIYEV